MFRWQHYCPHDDHQHQQMRGEKDASRRGGGAPTGGVEPMTARLRSVCSAVSPNCETEVIDVSSDETGEEWSVTGGSEPMTARPASSPASVPSSPASAPRAAVVPLHAPAATPGDGAPLAAGCGSGYPRRGPRVPRFATRRPCPPCPMCGAPCTAHVDSPDEPYCSHSLPRMNIHEWGGTPCRKGGPQESRGPPGEIGKAALPFRRLPDRAYRSRPIGCGPGCLKDAYSMLNPCASPGLADLDRHSRPTTCTSSYP